MLLAVVLIAAGGLHGARLPVDDVLDRRADRGRRGAVADDVVMWPNGTITYRIVTDVECASGLLPSGPCEYSMTSLQASKARRSIQVASDELQRVTGCRAVENPAAAVGPGVVLVFSDARSCYVDSVGLQAKRYNLLNLGWCLTDEPAVKHELLHLLGLDHEHQSPAADPMLIRCTEGSCLPSPPQCLIRSDATGWEATSYDPGSIMHYPLHLSDACDLRLTKEGKAAVKSSGLRPDDIGHGDNISSSDAAIVKLMYFEQELSPVTPAPSTKKRRKMSQETASIVAFSAGLLALAAVAAYITLCKATEDLVDEAPLLLNL